MTDRVREIALGVTILLLLGIGVAVDAATEPPRSVRRIVSADPLLREGTDFCPTIPQGAEGAMWVAAGAESDEPFLLGIEGTSDEPAEVDERITVEEIAPARSVGVAAFGARPFSTVIQELREPTSGIAAAGCASRARSDWYFAAGSSDPGFDERIVLYNPFPDEAVVRVSFFTESGERSPANASDIAVPSGESTTVKVNRYIVQQPTLGARVSAVRGRVAAWKVTVHDSREGTPGVAMSAGAGRPSMTWFFPSGTIDSVTQEVISLLNPSDGQAVATISLVTDRKVLQPEDLVEITVPRRSALDVDLRKAIGDAQPGGVSVVVRSENAVPLFAERSVFYEGAGFSGFTTEPGAVEGGTRWWVGPAAPRPSRDALVLLNVGDEPASVTISVFDEVGAAETPADLQDIRVPPGARRRISLDALKDVAAGLLIESDAPIVPERVTFSAGSNDVAALLGIRIP